jgi:glycerate kinase
MIYQLDQNMVAYSRLLKDKYRLSTDFPGAGAAGGTSVALKLFLHSSIEPGIDLLLNQIGFDEIIRDADLIFTGEGKLDRQSFRGKVIAGIASHAGKQSIPLYAITGRMEGVDETCFPNGLTGACALSGPTVLLSDAIAQTPRNIDSAISRIVSGKIPGKTWTE